MLDLHVGILELFVEASRLAYRPDHTAGLGLSIRGGPAVRWRRWHAGLSEGDRLRRLQEKRAYYYRTRRALRPRVGLTPT